MGMNIEDVIKVVESRDDWGDARVSFTSGFYIPAVPIGGWPSLNGQPDIPVIGEKHIRTHMGSYRNWRLLLITDVEVFLGFDENGELMDVHIWKVSGG